MSRTLRHTLNALDVANSLAPIPILAPAANLLRDVALACNQVIIHQRKCGAMADKCAQLLVALQDSSTRLPGTELNEAVDNVAAALGKIRRRVNNWSQYGRVKSWVKKHEIEEGLSRCNQDLDLAFQVFQTQSTLLTYQHHQDTADQAHGDNAEIKELLFQIVTSQNQLFNVLELQRAGEPVAASIMQAAQLELRQMRESQSSEMKDATNAPSPRSSRATRNERYLEYQHGILQLHQMTKIPPSIKILNGEVTKEGDLPVAGGTYSDIWTGYWLGEQKVALKALRNVNASDPKAQKGFEHEINVWASLQHDHTLPFLGIVTDLGQHMHIVSPWLENGNVLDYVKKHPEANKIHLLSGAAQGLDYLHQCNIIHGNMKCANILVFSTGEACICDFGMSKVMEDVTDKSASATLTAIEGSARWLAPELIEGSLQSPTKESDVYSFAMAMLELITMKRPYSDRKRDASVIHDITVKRRTPPFPSDDEARRWLQAGTWSLMEECWNNSPSERPQMHDVAERMVKVEDRFGRSSVSSVISEILDPSDELRLYR